MKSELIKYTDAALLNIVIEQLLIMNPYAQLGDKMTGPVGEFTEGKRNREPAPTAPKDPNDLPWIQITDPSKFGITVPAQPMSYLVTSGSIKLKLKDVENFRPAALNGMDLHLTEPTWIHPYTAVLQNREWLENYEVGDEVSTLYMDQNSFQASELKIKVTQEIVDEYSVLFFRFATHPV